MNTTIPNSRPHNLFFSNPILKDWKFQRTLFLLLGAFILVGCATKQTEPRFSDATRVTCDSEVFTAAAKSLIEPCNNPAEFGRCGCYLNGFKTSCDFVNRCLEIGLCEVAQSEPKGTIVTSSSKMFTATAKRLLESCNNPAEFGRCGCFLDGLKTSCAFVNRCLEVGSCKVVAN